MNCGGKAMGVSVSVLVVLIWNSFLPKTLLCQEASTQIQNELDRLEKVVSSHFSGDETSKTIGEKYVAELARINDTRESNYLFLSLRQLYTLHRNLIATIYQREKTAAADGGQEAFDREWQRVGEALSKKAELAAITSAKLPAAVRAIAQGSLNQSQPYYLSSRLYSRNTTTSSGLFYLGRAQANLDFALFCQQLKFAEARPLPRLRSLEAEIRALEQKVVTGYQKSGFGQQEKEKRYNRFIAANMTIKMVRELERADLAFGALYTYLEALLHFELIQKPEVTRAQVTLLHEKSTKIAGQLSHGEIDHSMGLLYWQLAQADLDKADPARFDGESLKKCAVILDTVLPEYFNIVEFLN